MWGGGGERRSREIRMTNSQTLGSNALPVVAYVYAKIHKEMSLQDMSDDKHSKWDCTSSIISNAQIEFTYINKSYGCSKTHLKLLKHGINTVSKQSICRRKSERMILESLDLSSLSQSFVVVLS